MQNETVEQLNIESDEAAEVLLQRQRDLIRKQIEDIYRAEHSLRVRRGIAVARAKRLQQNGGGN